MTTDRTSSDAPLAEQTRLDALAELVERLQLELLTYPSGRDGLDLAVGYRPAVTDLGFGGDWYDVVPVGPLTTALVVGDVAGHGVPAAAQMAQTKAALRALILASEDHADVFSRATRTLAHLDAAFVATAAMAILDHEHCTLRWATAGHLPPVLRGADACTELLWTDQQPPIGFGAIDQLPAARAVDLGSWLVLYTDGLVERRDVPIDDRLEELRGLVAALPADWDAREVRDAVLDHMVGEGADDDVAMVVAQVVPQTGEAG